VENKYGKDAPFYSFTKISEFDLIPVYLPCFVVTENYLKETITRYVNGVTGEIYGPKIYDHRLVSLMASFSSGLKHVFLSDQIFTLKSLLHTTYAFLMPYILVSTLIKVYPLAKIMLEETKTKFKEDDNLESVVEYKVNNDNMFWNWKNLVSMYNDWQHSETNKQESKDWNFFHDDEEKNRIFKEGEEAGIAHPDPLGYYRVLGLKGHEKASLGEISKHFKEMASMYHPDKIQNEEDKEIAEKHFQEVSRAYSVLRDKSLRKQYDNGLIVS
jgi:hypothetical protein